MRRRAAVAAVAFLVCLAWAWAFIRLRGAAQRAAVAAASPGFPRDEVRTVRGNSMAGILAPGQQVHVLRDFYASHPVARGDLVMFGRDRPLVKTIRGVPGDHFAVRDLDGSLRLILNGAVATTTRGEPYSLDGQSSRMLHLYEHDYSGVIPNGAYLLLGNTPTGSFDSSRFGLVDGRDLVGKVVP